LLLYSVITDNGHAQGFTGMRSIIAALVALAALWALDAELNNGKYTSAARQMISSMTGGRV
jgi:hypothetical protein